jgi:hypothetical protein
MPQSQKVKPEQLAAMAFKQNGVIEVDPEVGLQFLMVAGREVAFSALPDAIGGER